MNAPPSPSTRFVVWLDRAFLAGLVAGVLVLLQPWWAGGFRVGFFVTLACTVGQIVTSHLAGGRR